MARRKITEYDAKRMIAENIEGIQLKSILITPETSMETLPQQYPWLNEKLVVKPDQIFGRRKKQGLVLLDVDYKRVKEFIRENMNKEISIGKVTDKLTHFLIEPYIKHEEEYYLAIKSERENDTIYFSEEGGTEIEENWDGIKKIKVPTLGSIEGAIIDEFIADEPVIKNFIKDLFNFYKKFDFTYLEINPFTIVDGQIYLLDAVAVVDSCASFKNQLEYQPNQRHPEFPKEFGRKLFPEEEFIKNIDKDSGASLKLTVLNPEGKIWNILSGGGASIIYLDMLTNLGKGSEIANYGESSGNPTTEESYQYAKTILEMMTRELHQEGKVLFILGGIANFTDVKDTFSGLSKALEEHGDKLREQGVTIYVRRGGPNEEAGLKMIKETGEKLGLNMHVHGPETSMPEIIKVAETRIVEGNV